MLIDNFKTSAPRLISSLRKSNDKIVAFCVLRAAVLAGAKVVIVGKGASGKDTILNELTSTYNCFKKIVWNTSRPCRTGEVDNIDYHFRERFDATDIAYSKVFNVNGMEWNYWLNLSEWLSGSITVGTPDFIKALMESGERRKTVVIYIDEPDDVRARRLLLRLDADTSCRRILADADDFRDFRDFDYVLEEGLFKTKDEYVSTKDHNRN